jgi:uncharacterized membrane protein SirB2
MSAAVISISLFMLRMYWVVTGSNIMKHKWVKIVPHINDTVLLSAAIILAVSIEQYPFVHGWLTAKLLALLAYIILGMFALKRAKTMLQKLVYFNLAVFTFAYIVMVALTRTVTGIF